MDNQNIKEILNKLEKVKDGVGTFIGIDNKNANLLLDYITNLQAIEQEHQRINGELREENKRLRGQLEAKD